MPTPNAAHVRALAHCFAVMGLPQDVADEVAALLGQGLWNNRQDALLMRLVSMPHTAGEGYAQLIDKIRRHTRRAHATVLYHAFSKLGLTDPDAAWLARFLVWNLSASEADTLKVLLLAGGR